MDNFYFISAGIVVIAYMIGSIPAAIVVSRVFYGIDIREFGSRNAGATNTIRVLGPKAGAPVFFFDVLKGIAAVRIAYIVCNFYADNESFAVFKVVLSFAAIIGHVFPVFAGFRGGKGVATSLGVVLALMPLPALVSLGVFILLLSLFRYVSLGSIVSAISFPFVAIYLFDVSETAYIVFAFIISVFVPALHKKNVIRLIKGEESKFSFKKKTEFNK